MILFSRLAAKVEICFLRQKRREILHRFGKLHSFKGSKSNSLQHLPPWLHSFPRVLFRSSVHHGAASKGRFERTFSARSTVANETRNNSRRVSTRSILVVQRLRPSNRPPISRPSFSLTLRRIREREREKEKSPCKSMDPRLFYAEQSFVSFLSR